MKGKIVPPSSRVVRDRLPVFRRSFAFHGPAWAEPGAPSSSAAQGVAASHCTDQWTDAASVCDNPRVRETTFTELRNHAKIFFDAVEDGETVRVYRNGRPVADIVPVKAVPAWKKPPQARLDLGSLSLGDAVLADREEKQ